MTAEKKSLLITLNSFWTSGKGMSGGDQIAKQVFSKIWESFDNLLILTSDDGYNLFKDIPNAAHIKYRASVQNHGLALSYILRTIFGTFAITKKRVNCIYAGSDFFTDTIPAFVYKLLHKKTLWYQAIFHIYPKWKTRPGSKTKAVAGYYLQKVSHYLAKKADGIICINTQVKQDLLKNGLSENKIHLIYPGIDYSELVKTKKSPQIYEATFLARLNPSKGIYDLPKIWRLVCNKIPTAKLAIIGGGSEETIRKLENDLKEAGIENNVKILGYLENEQAFGIIKSSTCFVFPSHEEGFGIAIAEAMACSTPVVAWNLPVYNEIFGSTIAQVDHNDIETFANKAVEIISNPSIHAKMSETGREYIKRYSWDSVAQQFLKCLAKN